MAAAAAAEVTDTECSICHELFTDPKLVSCGHVLCRKCLLSWLSSQQDAPCPLCRRPIVDPETRQSQSVDDIVDSFPTDVTMKIWIQSEQLMQKDHVCQSCTTEAASNLCLQCQDFLCVSCTTMHSRLSATRHHTMESLSSLTAEKLAAGHSTPCQVHSNEVCKLYCSSHQVSICVLCASSKHKNCHEVKGLEERAEEIRAIFTELVATLIAQETELDQAVQELDKLLQEMEKKAQAAADEINQTFDEIETAVKKRRQEALETTMDTFATAKKSIQDGKACLLQKRGAITTYRTAGERGKRMAASGEVGDMAVAMKKRVVDDTSPLLAADAPTINEATFVMDTVAVLSGVQKALAEVGQCEVAPAAVTAQSQAAVLRFHDNCGGNTTLTHNGKTAERKGRDDSGGIVVSSQPMVPHRLYEVHLDERDAGANFFMWVGVVTRDPGRLTLPSCAGGWTSAVVFWDTYVEDHGKQINTDVGKKLVDLPKGSRVGVKIGNSRRLHLYIDGQNQGHAGVQVPHPCYAFFDVFCVYRKVTAQPVKIVKLKKSRQQKRVLPTATDK